MLVAEVRVQLAHQQRLVDGTILRQAPDETHRAAAIRAPPVCHKLRVRVGRNMRAAVRVVQVESAAAHIGGRLCAEPSRDLAEVSAAM